MMRCRSAGALFHCHQDLSIDAILGEIDLPGHGQIKVNCTRVTDVVHDVCLIQFCLHHCNHLVVGQRVGWWCGCSCWFSRWGCNRLGRCGRGWLGYFGFDRGGLRCSLIPNRLVVRKGCIDARLRLQEIFFGRLCVDRFSVVDRGLLQVGPCLLHVFGIVGESFVHYADVVEAVGILFSLGERRHCLELLECACPKFFFGQFVCLIQSSSFCEKDINMLGGGHQVGGDLLSCVLNKAIVKFSGSGRLIFFLLPFCDLVAKVLKRGGESRLLGTGRVVFLIEFCGDGVGGEGFGVSSILCLETYGQNAGDTHHWCGFCRSLADLHARLHRCLCRRLSVGRNRAVD